MLGPSLTSRQEVVQLLALTLQNIMFHTFYIFHMYDGDPSDEISDEGDGGNILVHFVAFLRKTT